MFGAHHSPQANHSLPRLLPPHNFVATASRDPSKIGQVCKFSGWPGRLQTHEPSIYMHGSSNRSFHTPMSSALLQCVRAVVKAVIVQCYCRQHGCLWITLICPQLMATRRRHPPLCLSLQQQSPTSGTWQSHWRTRSHTPRTCPAPLPPRNCRPAEFRHSRRSPGPPLHPAMQPCQSVSAISSQSQAWDQSLMAGCCCGCDGAFGVQIPCRDRKK